MTIEIPCDFSEDRDRWETLDGRYYFDMEAAGFAADFFPSCLQHHIGSEWNGRKFELLPYQAYVVRALFGWKRASDGLRRFRKVFLAVPKGSGKSPFGAGLGLFLAFFDGEAGSEVYAVAADRQQAGIVHESAKVMVQRNPRWNEPDELFHVYRDSIKRSDSTEYFQVLSSDASTKHGFRPHGIIFDEFHAQRLRDLFDTLYRGMGKRLQPVLVMITTAGDDDESICFEEWEYSRRVISGSVTDETYLPIVFELKSDEDWTSVEALKRVNPGYGITMKADYFESEIAAALAEPRKRNSFLQLHGNRWVNQATAWIPVEWWDACQAEVPNYLGWLEEQRPVLKDLAVTAGLDMAQKWDLACFALAFRHRIADAQAVDVVTEEAGAVVQKSIDLNYRVTLVPFFWLPEETLREHERREGIPYSQWREMGLLTVTEGATIDYSRIYRDITQKILPMFPRLKQGLIGYDPAFATDVAENLRRGGLKAEEILQNYTHMSEVCYVFEALVKAKRIAHGGNRILRNHVEQVAVKVDDARRMRPVKPKKSGKHIDGVVASLMAIKALATVPDRKRSTGVMVV